MSQVTPAHPLSPPEEGVDRLARLAARLLGAPVALVSVIGEDRVFLRSAVGMPEPWASHRSTPLAYSFCRHVVASGEPLIVEDARRHPLVRSNPAIRELSWISYAGVPLLAGDGRTAGALCVIDALPRLWSPRDVALLQDLAASVVTEMEVHDLHRNGDGTAGTADVFALSALPMGLIEADGGELVQYGPHKAILKKQGDDGQELQILMHDKHLIRVSAQGVSADDLLKIFDQAFVDRMEKPLGK